MANQKKPKEEKLEQVITNMTDSMNADLFAIANDYGLSRNKVVRIACNYLIENTKKIMKGLTK